MVLMGPPPAEDGQLCSKEGKIPETRKGMSRNEHNWACLHMKLMQMNTLWCNFSQSKLIPTSLSACVFKCSNIPPLDSLMGLSNDVVN